MQRNAYFKDLYYFIGDCLLIFIAVFTLIKINWGYTYLYQFIEDFLQPLGVNSSRLLSTPIGGFLGRNVLMAHIFNTILVVLCTAILIVSSYNIFNSIKACREKISFPQYDKIICAIVFLAAAYVIVHWAVLIFNAIPELEALYNPMPVNMRNEMPYPFMTHIQPNSAIFWFHIIPYLILNFLRVFVAGFFAKWYLSKKLNNLMPQLAS